MKKALNLQMVLARLEARKNFFAQLAARLVKKNPKFFRWIQLAAGVLAATSFILDELKAMQVHLPAWVEPLSSSVVSISGVITFILAQLPNQEPAAK